MSPTCLISQLWVGRLQSGAKHLVAVESWDAEACICICGWLWEDPISPTCLIRQLGVRRLQSGAIDMGAVKLGCKSMHMVWNGGKWCCEWCCEWW